MSQYSKYASKDTDVSAFLRSTVPLKNEKLKSLAVKEESLFMSLLLKDKDLLEAAVDSGITYSCFQNETVRRLFTVAAEYFGTYNGALLTRPALDSMVAGKNSPEEATDIKAAYDKVVAEFGVRSSDFQRLKENIESRFVQRQAHAICLKFIDELLVSMSDQKKIVAKFQQYASEISVFGDAHSFVQIATLSDTMKVLGEEILERRDHPENFLGIRCLWPQIDNDYNGFEKRRYMVITATEGGGKTTFMLNLSVNFALAGSNVVYITIESGNVDIGRRVLTIRSGVNYNRLKKGGTSMEHGLPPSIMNDLDKTRADIMASGLGDRFNLIQCLEGTSRDTICRLVQRVRAYKPVDVVVLDYLQVVGKEASFGERVDQAIADVSNKFRAWGRASNVLFVTANQIKADKGRKLQENVKDESDVLITKGDTSGSKEISGAADYMFGVWIPRSRDKMVVYSTKNRIGKDTQQYTLSYNADTGRVSHMNEFGDDVVANVRDDVSTPEARQRLRKEQHGTNDDTSILEVPDQAECDEPPDELKRPIFGLLEDEDVLGKEPGGFLVP